MTWTDERWSGNRHFKACHKCVAPKRHEGCHGHCKDYADDKAAYEIIRDSQKKENDVVALCNESFDRTCRYHGIKRKENKQ